MSTEDSSQASHGPCAYKGDVKPCKILVLTGGPGAGKTAIIEIVKRHFCSRTLVVSEAASILFGGGFIRGHSIPARKAAQRAIYHIQSSYEQMLREEAEAVLVVCDRGTLDGLAYWPEGPDNFFKDLQTTEAQEFARYELVIHLRSPSLEKGYNYQNPLRTETPAEAAVIDERILSAWSGHPRRFIVDSTDNFLAKVEATLKIIHAELPDCCNELDFP